jgi:hypothetical protein
LQDDGTSMRVTRSQTTYEVAATSGISHGTCDRIFFRWPEHDIKMDLLEIGLNVVDWIGLAQDRYR